MSKPLNEDSNLREVVNQMLDFFTEPDTGEKYLKDLEDEIVGLVKKHELQAKIDELSHVSHPARTSKQQHLGLDCLVEDRLKELKQELESYE